MVVVVMTEVKWERYQQWHERMERERKRKLLPDICFTQRVSESRKTASQIALALPGGWKRDTWKGVKKFLMTGAGC